MASMHVSHPGLYYIIVPFLYSSKTKIAPPYISAKLYRHRVLLLGHECRKDFCVI